MLILYAASLAMVLDLLAGDPAWLPHPVVWMGKYITWFEQTFRKRFAQRGERLRLCGAMLAYTLPVLAFAITAVVCFLAYRLHPVLFFTLQAFFGFQSLALKGLVTESTRVYRALAGGDLDSARGAVARIVGRDTEQLDEEGVIRAAVESVAENFSDGFAAPFLYFLIGGAPLALAYKAVNTLDSMVGYRNERYLDFGRASAKLDDVCNFIPSRLAALFLVASSGSCGGNAGQAFAVWRRDAHKHVSPNAGQTESVMAGALGVALGGSASYGGKTEDRAVLGDAHRACKAEDIKKANRMIVTAGALFAAVGCLVRGLVLYGFAR